MCDVRTDRQTHGRTDRQTDRQTDGRTDGHTDDGEVILLTAGDTKIVVKQWSWWRIRNTTIDRPI